MYLIAANVHITPVWYPNIYIVECIIDYFYPRSSLIFGGLNFRTKEKTFPQFDVFCMDLYSLITLKIKQYPIIQLIRKKLNLPFLVFTLHVFDLSLSLNYPHSSALTYTLSLTRPCLLPVLVYDLSLYFTLFVLSLTFPCLWPVLVNYVYVVSDLPLSSTCPLIRTCLWPVLVFDLSSSLACPSYWPVLVFEKFMSLSLSCPLSPHRNCNKISTVKRGNIHHFSISIKLYVYLCLFSV